jgi:pimeloyl-ACP methyl ester carboxylesterase
MGLVLDKPVRRNDMKTEELKVPGATLHVTVEGTGPTLLVIPGAPADVEFLAGIRSILAQRHEVVSFDLRGLSRSPLDGEGVDLGPADFAGDAAAVLDRYATGPVDVLGSSGGGIAGLELVTRYPGRVSTLVAHEPPIASLLPNGDAWIAFFDDVHETYKVAGAGPAMGQFIGSFDHYVGPEADPSKGAPPQFPLPDFSRMSPDELESFQRMGHNSEFFVAHIVRATPRYVPNIAALKASETKVVIGVGETSNGQMPHKAATKLAGDLGVEPLVFPGDHQGFATHTAAWAEAVEQALR